MLEVMLDAFGTKLAEEAENSGRDCEIIVDLDGITVWATSDEDRVSKELRILD
jgi:hypothetical protein